MKLIYSESDVKKLNIRRIINLSAGFLIGAVFLTLSIICAARRWEIGRPLAYVLSSVSGGLALSSFVAAIVFYLHEKRLIAFINRSLAPSKKLCGTVTEVYKKPIKKDGLMFATVLLACDDGIDRYLYFSKESLLPNQGEQKTYYVIHNNFVCGTASEAENE